MKSLHKNLRSFVCSLSALLFAFTGVACNMGGTSKTSNSSPLASHENISSSVESQDSNSMDSQDSSSVDEQINDSTSSNSSVNLGDLWDDWFDDPKPVEPLDKTINVLLCKMGYGESFIYELKEKFETAYADEGYKMNILVPSYEYRGDFALMNLASGYDAAKIDLYITYDVTPNQVSSLGDYGELCENLEDIVFNQTAIGYDRTESAEPISARIRQNVIPSLRADDGTMYGFNWAEASTGIVVNTKKLSAYGVTELPRTTNELFEIFDLILNGANGIPSSMDTNTYPLTYTAASQYQDFAFHTWLAQYDLKTYNEFLRMETQSENVWTKMDEGWEVFQNPDLKDVLETSYRLMETSYSPPNAPSKVLDLAQSEVVREPSYSSYNAVFMINGSWFLNEIKLNYPSELENITFIKMPVISSLGVKLFGPDTSYKLSNDDCDDLLSYICELVDDNKTLTEIADLVLSEMGINVAMADIESVAAARGVCYSKGSSHLAFIPKGSTKKDIAALVLRMMASDDYADTFISQSNGLTPYANPMQINSNYTFLHETAAIYANMYFHTVNGIISGTRKEIMRSNFLIPHISNLTAEMYKKSPNYTYAEAAETMYQNAIIEAKKLWDSYHNN